MGMFWETRRRMKMNEQSRGRMAAIAMLACAVIMSVMSWSGAHVAEAARMASWTGRWSSHYDRSETYEIRDVMEGEAGYFKLNRTHDAEMFYFFFEQRGMSNFIDGGSMNVNVNDGPVVLWMTGGPGCSSELAIFYENGPYHISKNLSLSSNPYSWSDAANIIYVDQPINTGFSYSDDPQDTVHYSEIGVANDMLDFLQEFFAKHPHLMGRDFYVTGESYAGHYVPAVSSRIFAAIENKEISREVINLKGFAIGNGLTDPAIQYGAYADYAFSEKLIPASLKAHVDNNMYPSCKEKIEKCGGSTPEVCMEALNSCENIVADVLGAAGNINVYDVRKQCTYPPLCYDFSRVGDYLNLPSTRRMLGVGNRKWQSCSSKVHQEMMADWMVDIEPLIPTMLEAGVRVLIYAGDKDFICNWMGNKRWTLAMPWAGQQSFNDAKETPFVVDGQDAGSFIHSGPLTFMRVYNAGHMVPMDQPKAALEMISRFVNDKPF